MSNGRSALRNRLSSWIDSVLHWDRRMAHTIGESRKLNKLERIFMTATYLGDGYIWDCWCSEEPWVVDTSESGLS